MEADWSRPIWEADGQNEILGLPMSQNGFVVPFLSELARVSPAEMRYEIGTGAGGFAVLLAASGVVGTVDIADLRSGLMRTIFPEHGINFAERDIFDIVPDFGGAITMAPGPVWVFCDGPDKNREVETFAPFLKPGDVIAAHDFAPTKETWNWHEVDEARVNAVAQREGLEVIPELEYDRKAAWWVRVKR